MLTRIEVRCCCQPQKLLGWLPLPSDSVQAGRVVSFVIPARFAAGGPFDDRAIDPPARVNLLVADFVDGEYTCRPALKSEETPIETLRRIPGFVEHTTHDESCGCERL